MMGRRLGRREYDEYHQYSDSDSYTAMSSIQHRLLVGHINGLDRTSMVKHRDLGRDLEPWRHFGLDFSKYLQARALARGSQQWRELSHGWH